MMLLAVYAVAFIFLGCAILIMVRFELRYLTGLNIGAAAVGLGLAGFTQGIYFNYDGYFGDFWTATEALNKAHDGLLSSVDFFSPIGPAYYHLYALTTLLDRTPTASTVMHAGSVAGFLAVLVSIIVLWRQISFIGLSVVIVSVVTVAVSGRGNGELLNHTAMHFLAPYNRWAWAFFIPVALSLALPRHRNWTGDVVLGVTIALLLMMKVTYGAAALGLFGVRILLVPGAWRQLPLIAGGLFLSLGALETATGQVTGHLHDLAVTASLPENGLRVAKLFAQLGEMGLFCIVATVVYFATAPTFPVRPWKINDVWAFLRPLILIFMVAGAGCAVLMQNHYGVEAAVYPLLTLIALEWTNVLRETGKDPVWSEFRARLLISASLLFIVFYPIVDVGMHVGQRLQYRLNGPDPQLANTPYADLRFEPYLVSQKDSLLNTVSDGHAGILAGFEMLQAAGAGNSDAGRVATLAFANPFPMMLGKPSPQATPIWLHEGRSFSDQVFIPPDVFFQGVDFVMVTPGPTLLRDIYQDTLDADFVMRSRTRYWDLFVRREQ